MSRASAVVVLVILVALTTLTPVAGAAQEATPPPGATAPGPEECRVPPRSPEAVLAVLATPAAEPEATEADVPTPGEQRTVASEDELPTGEPADAATVAAVEPVVREVVACFNARALFQVFSLMSDDVVRGLLAEMGETATESELATAAATRPTPIPEGGRDVILAIRDARVFPDGRVGVVVVSDKLDDEEGPGLSLIVLVETEGRWLADATIVVDPEAAEE